MGSSHVRVLALSIVLALALPAVAGASLKSTLAKSRHLWATVNICDTAGHPDEIGIRASMPGTGKKSRWRMYMRFRLEYMNAEGTWTKFSGRGPNSGYQPVGPARFKARQSGWLFPFQPGEGQVFKLRGVVDFQWRKGVRPLATLTEVTTSGHHVTIAEPEGYSAATCEIKG